MKLHINGSGRSNKGGSIPLRSYSSTNPLEACTPPSSINVKNVCGGSALHPNRLSTQKKPKSRRSLPSPAKSIKFKAKDFCRQIGGSLDDEYELKEALGQGAFGDVYSCVHRATGAERAVKVLPKSRKEKDNEQVRNEFQIVKKLDHPNLIKVYHLFESKDAFHIVFDLIAGGDLLEELERVGRLQEHDAAALMNHLLSCINYCHSQHK